MNLQHYLAQRAHHAAAIGSLTSGLSDEQARWRPAPDAWSILEVINHLHDEERADFRVRLDYILHRPGQPWPPINPQGWVTERRYNSRDLAQSRQNFLDERQKSLAWLRQLDPIDWTTLEVSPFGQMYAGDMFAAWVAHDLLHLRQLIELHYAYAAQDAQPYNLAYAGDW